MPLSRVALAALLVAAPSASAGQTLTPTRGLFRYTEGLTPAQRRDAAKDSMLVSITAEGSLRAAVTMGVTIGGYNWSRRAVINLVGQTDTITGRYGRSILYPTAGNGVVRGDFSGLAIWILFH